MIGGMTRCPECHQTTCSMGCPSWEAPERVSVMTFNAPMRGPETETPTLAHPDAEDVPDGPHGTVRTRAAAVALTRPEPDYRYEYAAPTCACGAPMTEVWQGNRETVAHRPEGVPVRIVYWACTNTGCRRVEATWEPIR